MLIQKRVYKYLATRAEIHSCIDKSKSLSSFWDDENNISLKNKEPFSLFRLNVTLDELESHGKLKVSVHTNYWYLLLYLFPLALTLYGFFRQFRNSEKSLLLILGGISLGIFIFLITTYLIDTLKKKFKETLNMS